MEPQQPLFQAINNAELAYPQPKSKNATSLQVPWLEVSERSLLEINGRQRYSHVILEKHVHTNPGISGSKGASVQLAHIIGRLYNKRSTSSVGIPIGALPDTKALVSGWNFERRTFPVSHAVMPELKNKPEHIRKLRSPTPSEVNHLFSSRAGAELPELLRIGVPTTNIHAGHRGLPLLYEEMPARVRSQKQHEEMLQIERENGDENAQYHTTSNARPRASASCKSFIGHLPISPLQAPRLSF